MHRPLLWHWCRFHDTRWRVGRRRRWGRCGRRHWYGQWTAVGQWTWCGSWTWCHSSDDTALRRGTPAPCRSAIAARAAAPRGRCHRYDARSRCSAHSRASSQCAPPTAGCLCAASVTAASPRREISLGRRAWRAPSRCQAYRPALGCAAGLISHAPKSDGRKRKNPKHVPRLGHRLGGENTKQCIMCGVWCTVPRGVLWFQCVL